MTSKLRWNLQGAVYAAASVTLLVLGATLQATYVVALGGLLGTLLVVDAVWAVLRAPDVRSTVSPKRVDEEGTVRVRVDGDHLRRDQSLRVLLPPSFELEGGTDLWTPRASRESHTFEARAMVRGPQKVGPVQMRSWSPLRLWASEQNVEDVHVVEVVPRKESVKDVLLSSRTLRPMQGRFQINRPGQGFDFFSLREYQSSDTIRSINWKATARKGDFIVNQRQQETQTKVTILLDSRVVAGAGPIGKTPLDRGCRAALGLFADALANRDGVAFVAYGRGLVEPPPGKTDRVINLASLLARLPPDGDTGLWDAWVQARKETQTSSGPVIVITSAEADPRLEDAVSDMLARGHGVSVISPQPMDDLLPGLREKRRHARERLLDRLRNLGATAVDWSVGAPLVAERPSTAGVGA